MARPTNDKLQEKLGIIKWIDSEKKGEDTCGEYDYCPHCIKTAPTPCAKAYNKSRRKKSTTKKRK